MRMLVHRNVKTRPVKGGKKFVQVCPECGEHATFREVETTEKIGIFFALDLVTDKERGYQCSICSEIFDLKDDAPTAAAPPPELPPPPDPDVERRRRDEERRRQDQRVEDELAALKKRLGR